MDWQIDGSNLKWIKTSASSESSFTSDAFEFQHGKLFYGNLTKETRSYGQFVAVRLICQKLGLQRYGFEVAYVTYSKSHDKIRKLMEQVSRSDGKILLFQSSDLDEISEFTKTTSIVFHVHLVSLLKTYKNQLEDSSWSIQLWEAAENKLMTDVTFIFGEEESLGAHRFILSARSPVFAAMFNSGMIESRTGRVEMKNVDVQLFRNFLKFLYTGRLDISGGRHEDLLALADQ